MQARRFWVECANLKPQANSGAALSLNEERKKLDSGQVRLTTSDFGSEVKWVMQSACFASLFRVQDWLQTATAPIVLRFYIYGWFEEFYNDNAEASRRIDAIIARGDRHFISRTVIKEFNLDNATLTPLLHACMAQETTAEEHAVQCVYEDKTQQFSVERIGPKSVIKKVWGGVPTSFPCQSNGSYGQSVSQAYSEVLHTGKPHYDHIIAAMRMPDNEVCWVPYQRLVIPKATATNRPTVLVVSEITSVDIQLV